MSFTEMFVSCGILHFRGGWVGIAHSRFCDVFLDPAQLILRFPPWMGGKCLQSWWLSMNAKMMRSKQFGMQQCNADDVMQHPFPRSISPLIAVAENKCRVLQIRLCTCQWDCGFWKNSQINYLTRHVFVYECMSSLYVYAIHMITSRQRLRRRMCYVGLPRSLKSEKTSLDVKTFCEDMCFWSLLWKLAERCWLATPHHFVSRRDTPTRTIATWARYVSPCCLCVW